MANGFLTSSPGSRHGNTLSNSFANGVIAQKFTAPGSGTLDITELGIWLSADASQTHVFRLAIFTHDAVNNCPEAMVANSDLAELTHNTTTVTKKYSAYSTKPQVTGGSIYWFVYYMKDSLGNYDELTSGGSMVYRVSGQTYPTFPTGDTWHTHNDSSSDSSMYAVYAAAGGGGAVPIAAIIHHYKQLGVM